MIRRFSASHLLYRMPNSNFHIFGSPLQSYVYSPDWIVKRIFQILKHKYICRKIKECPHDVCRRRARVVIKELLEKIPDLRSIVSGDIVVAFEGDPAPISDEEVILSYPRVLAIATYGIAHELYLLGVPFIFHTMSERVHSLMGIAIQRAC